MGDNGIYWNNATECSMENMLVDVGPSGSLEIWDVVLLWAAISAFLIQPVLANWIKCIFILIHPLSAHSGRVVIPCKQEHEEPDSPVAAKSNLDRAIEELKKECEEKQLIEDIVRFERKDFVSIGVLDDYFGGAFGQYCSGNVVGIKKGKWLYALLDRLRRYLFSN